ncbi:MAG: hypothetical protein A3G29_17380 [Burkholderiales bacterium RIFCSPLOWO2_12_FULL_64_99]|nr:MAG: hypothetical protein A3E52_07070 [Burkholderiales bacterium RIFCSPHIGHO2_12_FULL_63_20]OGB62030.1 MAG: hypothetical protein A3G29_17380 [Burkholderiales bacterium RIFCSPLOWO2_12_FULL_64_99]
MNAPDHPLSPEAIQTAAHALATRRLTGRVGGALPDPCRPTTLSDALAVQAAVSAELAQRAGERVVGWKCGLPGADTWVLAPLYASTLYRADDRTDPPVAGWPVWAQQGRVKVEPELAFVLGRDLPPRAQAYDTEEVRASIASAHLALELIDSRYDEQAPVHFADRLADGLVNQGLWLGPAIDLASAYAAQALDIAVTADAQPLLSQHGAHPAGDPLQPLCWLAEFLRGRGQGLQAGQVVITGSYAGAPWVPVGPMLQVRFGHLGTVALSFQTRPRG